MSGHSKFANIKHKKEKNDAAKGKIFTIIGREIAVAVREGGADPNNNSKLRDVISKAKSLNVPNDTIERGIKKAAGNSDLVNYEKNIYEGYGPSGVAIIVETLTDNKNRTAANVRSAFTKGSGNIGNQGSVSYLFNKKGIVFIDKEDNTLEVDELMMLVLDLGANDFLEVEEGFEIEVEESEFFEFKNKLDENNIKYSQAELMMIPSTTVKLVKEEDIKAMNKLLSLLEEDDDVQNVYHNLEE